MKKQTKKTLWRGLTSTSAVLMVVSLFGTQCAITYTGTLNSYLGTTTSRIVSTGDPSAEDTNYYTSEFGDYSAENLQKLIQATYDESVLEQEEGSVLLRNNNSALPLSPNSHVTLFGHAVVQPVYAPGGANSGAAVAAFSRERNRGFNTAVGTTEVSDRNTIPACVHGAQSVTVSIHLYHQVLQLSR